MTPKTGDRVRLPHWKQFFSVVEAAAGKIWLGDGRGGKAQYGVGLDWVVDDGKPQWIQWSGGDAPTTAAVEIFLADGRKVEMPAGCAVDWQRTGAKSDILFYRVMEVDGE